MAAGARWGSGSAIRAFLPLIILAAALLVGLLFGSVDLTAAQVFAAIADHLGLPFGGHVSNITQNIVWELRLPRVLSAACVGIALGVAGALFQAVLRNPLADPYVIGTSAGAQVGVAIATVLPVQFALLGFGSLQLLSFVGALLTVGLVYALARRGGTAPVITIVLAGFVVSSFLISATTLIAVMGNRTSQVLAWTLGGIDVSEWSQLGGAAIVILAGTAGALLLGQRLDVLLLGEEQAQYLGVQVERLKIVAIVLAALLTGIAVSLAGVVAFVGLVAPHSVRLLYGSRNRTVIPLAAVSGAAFLVLADTIARAIIPPTEIPLGVITPVIGAPLFLYLLRTSRRAYGL